MKINKRYAYTVNGEVTIKDAEGKILENSALGNRWMFTGREWLQEISLYDFRNRVYSPKLGRFLQPDPIKFNAGDVNIYRYAFNNPIGYTDPSGLTVYTVESNAFGVPGAVHIFTWSTVTQTGAGRSGSSGNAGIYNGVPPYFTNADLYTGKYTKHEVPNLNGLTEAQFISSVRNNSSMNDGVWIPYVNDCHTDLKDSFTSLGITYPTESGRFSLDNWCLNKVNTLVGAIYNLISWFWSIGE